MSVWVSLWIRNKHKADLNISLCWARWDLMGGHRGVENTNEKWQVMCRAAPGALCDGWNYLVMQAHYCHGKMYIIINGWVLWWWRSYQSSNKIIPGREFLWGSSFCGLWMTWPDPEAWIVSQWFAWTGIQILTAGRDIDNMINGQAEIQTGPVTPW